MDAASPSNGLALLGGVGVRRRPAVPRLALGGAYIKLSLTCPAVLIQAVIFALNNHPWYDRTPEGPGQWPKLGG